MPDDDGSEKLNPEAMRSVRDSEGSRPRAAVVLASLGLHIGVAAAALWLVPSRSVPIQELDLVEITLLDPAQLEAPPEPEVNSDVTAGADASEPVEPRPTPSARDARESPSNRPPASSEPVELDEPAPSSDAAAIALNGLRGSSRAAGGPVPRPRVVIPVPDSPSSPAPKETTTPQAVPGPRTDRQPRSLADAGFRPHKDGTYRYRDKQYPFKVTLHPNGRIEFKVKGTQAHRMGVSEAVRSAAGRELFVAAKKRLLKQTFELRLNLAASWAQGQMDKQLRALYRQLLQVWGREQWSAARRRKELFSLWDDCEESLSLELQGVEPELVTRIDRARSSAGKKARAKIIEFIGRHLPYGSQDAYSPDELHAFNARRQSKERFAPYRSARTSGPD